MISFEFFDGFSMNARLWTASLNWQGTRATWQSATFCPVGACGYYDGITKMNCTLVSQKQWCHALTLGKDVAAALNVPKEEVWEFIELWDMSRIKPEELSKIMRIK